jgi:hypothetical protein
MINKEQNAQLTIPRVIGSVLSHSDFISCLKNLGFDVRVIGNNNRDYTFSLQVNAIRISNQDYSIFGYYCGGAYATCARTNKEEFTIKDIEIAIRKCSEVIMNEIVSISKTPTYFDCRDYLNSLGKSKIEKESIKRVLSILKENYQELIKSVVGFQHYR